MKLHQACSLIKIWLTHELLFIPLLVDILLAIPRRIAVGPFDWEHVEKRISDPQQTTLVYGMDEVQVEDGQEG